MVTVASIVPVAFSGQQLSAQSLDNASTNVLRVTPVRTDIEVLPGDTGTVEITVSNVTDQDIIVRPIANDFTAGDESGTPALILDQDQYADTHSLKRFMVPLGDITIPANDSVTVDVAIRVPESAQAGGYFGAIRLAPVTPGDGGQVNLSTSVASLILMTVPGDTVEKMSLTNFDIQQNGKTGSYFNSANDITAAIRFQNEGNVQLGPFGKITVTQGDTIVYEADFNVETPRDMVLPDSARRWEVPLKNIGSFGNYTVQATLTYGKSNQTVEVSRSFWVIPVLVIVAAIGGTLLLVGIIVGIWLFIRSYKRRILRGYRRR